MSPSDAPAEAPGPPPHVVVLLAHSPLRIAVDPLSGAVHADARSRGLHVHDAAALEVALRLAETWGARTTACTVGRSHADAVLRDALACGADAAARVDADASAAEPAQVATWLADAVAHARTATPDAEVVVLAGAHGADAATGAVPAFLAHALDAVQALGLVEVTAGDPGVVDALRRADRGVRERIRARAPMVLSVEGAAASLRRAGLGATLSAGRAPIEVLAARAPRPTGVAWAGPVPYRPRTQLVAPPEGASARDRIEDLTAAATPRTPPRTVELEPADAADAVLAQLGEWGVGPDAR